MDVIWLLFSWDSQNQNPLEGLRSDFTLSRNIDLNDLLERDRKSASNVNDFFRLYDYELTCCLQRNRKITESFMSVVVDIYSQLNS